ncbi:MAG: response regulator [Candidatus Thorarchaeota archaeon]
MVKRVIVVDDDSDVSSVMETYLRTYLDDFQLISATDGRQAIEVTERLLEEGSSPDVVLMDLKMHPMDGIECTEALVEKGIEDIYILTAYIDSDMISEALSAGAKGIMNKADGYRDIACRAADIVRS